MATKISFNSAVLESYESQPLDFRTALAELIDNSFDAGATRVDIQHQGSARAAILTIADDGIGCDNLQRMMTIGQTYGRRSKRLGRYGIGFKESAIWLAQTVDIRSIADARLNEWRIDWKHVKEHDWDTGTDPRSSEVTDASREALGFRARHGMVLTFMGLRHRFPAGKPLQSVVDELGYTFSPAISQGRAIIVTNGNSKPIRIAPVKWPPLDNVVDAEIAVNGKRVRIYAGIVPADHPNKYPGFTYILHHRVIQAATGLGARGYSVARVTGRIELNDAWKIAKNKTALVDSDVESLEESVFATVEGMLKVAQTQTDKLVSDAIKTALDDMLNQGRAKAKRGKGEKRGSVVPTGTGTPHKNATITQTGEGLRGSRKMGRLSIEYTEDESNGIGYVDFAGNRIWLCVTHPFVKHTMGVGNREALACLASSLYVDCVQHSDKKEQTKALPTMADVNEKFGRGMTDILAGMVPEEESN